MSLSVLFACLSETPSTPIITKFLLFCTEPKTNLIVAYDHNGNIKKTIDNRSNLTTVKQIPGSARLKAY